MKIVCLCVAFFMLLVVSCRGNVKNATVSDSIPVEKSDLTHQAQLWADSVCRSMTLRQKVSQLFLPAVYASDDMWTLRLLRQYSDSCIGGIVLLKGDSRCASLLADSMARHSTISPFISIDAEWGLSMRLADAPEFPSNNAIGENTDDQLMYDYGYELARECRLLGINMVLGPVVDVNVPGGSMRRRSLGEDPHRVANLALAYARGLEDGNVISVAKHFPGHGSVSADSHKRKGIIERSLHEMDSIDLYPFRKWVEQRLSAIMVGHLAVPSIDSEMRPAAVSHTVISDLLRSDMGFSGLILTDALNMKGAEGYTSVDAIEAGADMLVAPDKTFAEVDRVVDAVINERLAERQIDEHVRRILFFKYMLGLADSRRNPASDSSSISSLLASPEADSISRALKK